MLPIRSFQKTYLSQNVSESHLITILDVQVNRFIMDIDINCVCCIVSLVLNELLSDLGTQSCQH